MWYQYAPSSITQKKSPTAAFSPSGYHLTIPLVIIWMLARPSESQDNSKIGVSSFQVGEVQIFVKKQTLWEEFSVDISQTSSHLLCDTHITFL